MRGVAPHGHCAKACRTHQGVRITQEGFVAGSKDGEARLGQLAVPQCVFDLPESVDPAVEFDHEHELGTQEVGD
jgi:hypothetical protein